MNRPKRPKRKGFSIFRSAREEAGLKVEEANRDAEGGHMSCTSGRIVSVPGSDKPFKAIMSQESGGTSEHRFATMQEAEAFLRRNTPRPQPRSTHRITAAIRPTARPFVERAKLRDRS
jgi:hypothetical protein